MLLFDRIIGYILNIPSSKSGGFQLEKPRWFHRWIRWMRVCLHRDDFYAIWSTTGKSPTKLPLQSMKIMFFHPSPIQIHRTSKNRVDFALQKCTSSYQTLLLWGSEAMFIPWPGQTGHLDGLSRLFLTDWLVDESPILQPYLEEFKIHKSLSHSSSYRE